MPGDSGIFATCNKGREAKCVGELRDLFAEYAEQLYGDGDSEDENDKGTASIENDIQAELAGIQKPPKGQLFVPVKLDVQCGKYLPTCLSSQGFAYCGREEVQEREADLI
jgi:tRNA acetyltransferase TAN1